MEISRVQNTSNFTYIDNNSCGSNFSDQSLDSMEDFESDFCKYPNAIDCNYDNQRLIGDLSREHTLPILNDSKHKDLASIDSKTLTDLLNGKYSDQIGKFLILDARYPYEYSGGHIMNAESSYEKEAIIRKLFNEPMFCDDGKRVVLVFHCEFSIERGPKLMREIREFDRLMNKHCYPKLFYPEIYLLEGGYKSFFDNHMTMCEPKSYLPMLNNGHRNEMKYFRRKSKTWELDNRTLKPNKLSSRTKLNF